MTQAPSRLPVETKPDHEPVAPVARWRKRLPWIIGGAVAVAALGAAVALLGYWRNRDVVTIYGNVDIRDVSLGFRVPGRLANVLKDEGDRVRPGELVARLDPTTYEQAVAERTADVAVKQAMLKYAGATFERNDALVKSGVTSKNDFDSATATRDQAAASLDLARAQLAAAQTDLADTQIHAPSDGVVITRAQEPGAILGMGNVVLMVSLDRPIWVRAYIPEPELGRVYPGKSAEIFTDTQPNRPYHGKIGYISPEAEFTPKAVETTQLRTSLVYRLRLVVDDADPGLRQGMPVTVKIHLK